MKNLTRRAYSGIRQRNVNETVWSIYGYKFFQNEDCFTTLIDMSIDDLDGTDFDVIVPIKPRNSGSDIVYRLSVHIATHFDILIVDCLNQTNTKADKAYLNDVKGKKILIVDDVYTTGRTAAKAEKAIKALKPRSISFYAIAKAKDK